MADTGLSRLSRYFVRVLFMCINKENGRVPGLMSMLGVSSLEVVHFNEVSRYYEDEALTENINYMGTHFFL